jgi:hypothetical protein
MRQSKDSLLYAICHKQSSSGLCQIDRGGNAKTEQFPHQSERSSPKQLGFFTFG